MRLQDVKDKSQFQQFYKENNLNTTQEKIDYLIEEMGIIATTGYDFTPEENLLNLQLHALVGWDRISYRKDKILNKEGHMKVINFFGGPGIGKSTIAAELFVNLKKQQKEVELITEYAKDLVYEERYNVLQDQLYILAKQNRKLLRLIPKKIEYAITDSPILLGIIYLNKHGGSSKNLTNLILEVFNSYHNINFFLERHPTLEYKKIGRVEQEREQAVKIDNEIQTMLNNLNIPYLVLPVKSYNCEEICSLIC